MLISGKMQRLERPTEYFRCTVERNPQSSSFMLGIIDYWIPTFIPGCVRPHVEKRLLADQAANHLSNIQAHKSKFILLNKEFVV